MKNSILKNFITFLVILIISSYPIYSELIPRKQLIKDIRQLAKIIEASHPDPYIRGGGKIAFHKRLHELMRSVPEEGMEKGKFQKALLPFVAAVGDGHTSIHVKYEKNEAQPGGVPLYFSIIEESLYVSGVYKEQHKHLIGSLLLSVNNILISELCQRVKKLRGMDNKYGPYVFLSGRHYLYYKSQLEDLIPEWDGGSIQVGLQLSFGEVKKILFQPDHGKRIEKITKPTLVTLPSTKNSEFAYNFTDKKKKVAILKVDGMYSFRENFELVGLDNEYNLKGARQVYEWINKKDAPKDNANLLRGIPSATKTFLSLVKEMKKNKTETLIIDLRFNGGGNSTLANFLLYFLFGKDHLIDLYSRKTGYEIIKFSDLYFKEVKEERKGTGNFGFELSGNDYWFEEFYEKGRFQKEKIRVITEGMYRKIPTFYKEYKSGKYAGYYCPKKIIVLTSPFTYSSGYTMMKMLNESGAILVGTPSSQSENAPGWILNFKLENSGLTGWIPCKYYVAFSDRLKDRIYQVDHPITYKKLKEYNFDPNAAVLLALENL